MVRGMIKVILAVSILANIVLFILLVMRRRENRRISRQMHELSEIDSNSIVHTSYSVGDVTELAAEINRLLERLRQMQIATKRKSERMDMMLANISHDLRTPLTSALGYIDMINTQRREGDFTEDIDRELEIIEKRMHRLSELIDAFFEFSKVISSDKEPERSELSMVAVLEECIAHYYDDYSTRHRSIDFSNPAGRQKFYSNRNMLIRVFDNLIGNALKHGNGDLRVISELEENGGISVKFINEAETADIDAEHIFDEFYTRDISRTGGNTGLGLAIAKEFTELLGGRITADISPGRMEIAVRFPLK